MKPSLIALFSSLLFSLSAQANITFSLQGTFLDKADVNERTVQNSAEGAAQTTVQKALQEATLQQLQQLLMPVDQIASAIEPSATFEHALRDEIRRELSARAIFQPTRVTHNLSDSVDGRQALPEKIEVNLSWATSDLQSRVVARLAVLDNELLHSLHINTSGNVFNQLKALVPALYNIEERRGLQQLLTLHDLLIPPSSNHRIAELLDRQVRRSAAGLTFNMKALVREGKAYEENLIAALQQESLSLTAKQPDFVLDYEFFEKDRENEQGGWLFYGKTSLLNDLQIQVASAEIEVREVADSAEQAQRQALAKLAAALSQDLRAVLLEKR